LSEHAQAVAQAQQRAAQGGQERLQASRALTDLRSVAGGRKQDRRERDRQQHGERRERDQQQGPIVPVENADAREHDAAEDGEGEQVEQRLGDHRAEDDGQGLAGAAQAPRDDQRA
jgi:hypothetical protein